MPTELVKYNAACHAIAVAKTVDEVKGIRDRTVAIQEYAKQAKNRQMEIDAAEIRIRAERRLGEMLAETPKNKGAMGIGTSVVPQKNHTPLTLSDMKIDKKLSSKSQKIAAMPEQEFESKLSDWRDRLENSDDRIIGDIAHVSHNSGENEWYTPTEYIEAAIKTMGDIDCDPASSEMANKTVGAKVFYTAEHNGLEQPWGKRVWLNPPYAQPLVSQFCEALVSKVESNEVEQAIVLVNNATETSWFQRLLSVASSICLIRGRIRFIDPEGKASGAPLQGQAILYCGQYSIDFLHNFQQFGVICDVVCF